MFIVPWLEGKGTKGALEPPLLLVQNVLSKEALAAAKSCQLRAEEQGGSRAPSSSVSQ